MTSSSILARAAECAVAQHREPKLRCGRTSSAGARPSRWQRIGRGLCAERWRRKYSQRLAGETLMVNELYLRSSIGRSPGVGVRALSRALWQRIVGQCAIELEDALDACEKTRADGERIAGAL